MTRQIDKIAHYASAIDSDVSAKLHKLVVSGKVERLYGGTVHGEFVMTEKGSTFETFSEARKNAFLFVEQARAAFSARTAP